MKFGANFVANLPYAERGQRIDVPTVVRNMIQTSTKKWMNVKESTMKKMTLAHSEAVSAAKALLIYKADRNQPPRYKALLEEQVTLLGDVYWWILHDIYTPGLPYVKPDQPDEPVENHDGI